MATAQKRKPQRRKPTKPNSTKRRSPPKRAQRSLLASRPSLPSLELEVHHVDILALALIAIGVFLGGVAYGHWAGGALGEDAVRGLRFVFGALGYAAPAALVSGGALILLRELRPPARPLRTGLACLVAALTLALAGGTLGLGPGPAAARELWRVASFERRGGVIGQAELWVTSHLFSATGADIVAVFLLIAGLILVSGATLAGVLRVTGVGMVQSGRALRRSTEELAATVARRPATAAARAAVARTSSYAGGRTSRYADDPRLAPEGPPEPELLLPPEPDTAELIVRATHVEAPPIAGEVDPGGLEEDGVPEALPEPEPLSGPGPGADGEPEITARRPISADDLTPQGRYRASVTDDPEFEWRVPGARFLTRSTGEAAKPDTAGQEQVARTLTETLGHFGIEAKVIGRVTGPHITRYEMRLAPGIKVAKVAQLKDDLAYALAATDIRILAPIPGKQAVGVEVPNARRRIVHLGDVFQDPPPDWSPLTVWLGKDIAGRAIGADLAKMPHLLVAGTTGAGKSACVNAMLS